MKRLFLKAAGVAAAGALLKACGGGGGGGSGNGVPVGGDALLGLLQQDGNFSLLLQAADKAGLIATLGDGGQNLTIFAPDNAAFERLAGRLGKADGAALIGALRGDQWADIVNFAMLSQRRSIGSLTPSSGQDIRSDTLYSSPIGNAQLIFVNEGGPLYIWDGVGRSLITLQRTDLAASNGVAHVPSDVLLPRFVLTVSQMLRASVDSLSNFGAAMSPSDINELDRAGPYTVFVPINDAPGTINVRRHVLARLLGSDNFPTTPTPYMTLSGGSTTLKKGTTPPVLATLTDSTNVLANVVDVDFFGSNGVIHVIDKVLT